MIAVVEATPSEIDALVALEAALFVEDAGCYDPFSDRTWPEREVRRLCGGLPKRIACATG